MQLSHCAFLNYHPTKTIQGTPNKIAQALYRQILHCVSEKRDPDIIDCNLKGD